MELVGVSGFKFDIRLTIMQCKIRDKINALP